MSIIVFDHTIAEVAGKGEYRGVYNKVVCDLVVFEQGFDKLEGLWLAFNDEDQLKNPRLAAFLGVENCQDGGKEFVVYAFETTYVPIYELDFQSNQFGIIRSVITQCLMAIDRVHSVGYVIDDLASPDSYLFSQAGESVTVKLKPYKCKPLDLDNVVESRRRKTFNIHDFARMLLGFFFGPEVELAAVMVYDAYMDEPRIFFVPRFLLGKEEKAYCIEVIHFLKAAFEMEDNESPARFLNNEPVVWDELKRAMFYIVAFENINALTEYKPFQDVNNIPEFRVECGRDWKKFAPEVRADLKAYVARASTSSSGQIAPTGPASTSRTDLPALASTSSSGQIAPPGPASTSNTALPALASTSSSGQIAPPPASTGVRTVPKSSVYTTSGGLMFLRGREFDFLRCTRNLLGHSFFKASGVDEYLKYDKNISKGFDLMLSCKIPGHLISIYEGLKDLRQQGKISGTNLDPFFDEL